MRTWIVKPEFRSGDWWPGATLMCVEVPGDHPDENMLVWIQHDGRWQFESISTGCPTAHMFDMFGEKDG